MHLQRWQKHGDPSVTLKGGAKPTTLGCTIPGCDQTHKAKGYCQLHYWRWRDHGDPLHQPKLPGILTYTSVHRIVRRERGQADAHPCARCGGRAEQWAYDHGDPDERFESGQGPYSLSVDRYIPLCVRCHIEFDRGPSWFGELPGMMEVKRCPRCQLVKPLDQFPPRHDRRPGAVLSRCRDCDRRKSRAASASRITSA